MKLRHQPDSHPRTRSADALVHEEQPESEFFDPRVDFPAAELARLKALASLPVHEKADFMHDGLNIGWWLKFVDPEFRQLVEAQPGFEQDLREAFKTYFIGYNKTDPKRKWHLPARAMPVIQLFPQLRQELRKKQFDPVLPELLSDSPRDSAWQIMRCLVPLVQLYPERRAEFVRASDLFLFDRLMTAIGKLDAETMDTLLEVDLVANALLLFPEKRFEILNRIPKNKHSQWISYFKGEQQPFEHYIYELGFNLTVIGAEEARIDETGQIQLDLKRRTAPTVARPLPDRPLA